VSHRVTKATIGLEKGAQESMRWQTKSTLIESCTHHDEPLRRSKRFKARGHKTGSQLRRCDTPLTYEVLQVLPGDLQHRTTQPHHKAQRERRKTPCKFNYYLFCLSKNCFSIFSLFSRREGGGEIEGYCAGRCRLRRSFQTGFITP
jgi:hypothetical protein